MALLGLHKNRVVLQVAELLHRQGSLRIKQETHPTRPDLLGAQRVPAGPKASHSTVLQDELLPTGWQL